MLDMLLQTCTRNLPLRAFASGRIRQRGQCATLGFSLPKASTSIVLAHEI